MTVVNSLQRRRSEVQRDRVVDHLSRFSERHVLMGKHASLGERRFAMSMRPVAWLYSNKMTTCERNYVEVEPLIDHCHAGNVCQNG